MPDEKKPGEFKTSLMGFKKSDVLTYIDDLSAKALAEQKEREEKARALQKEIELLKQDREQLIIKTKEVCDKLTEEERRSKQEEERARTLSEQLLQAEETANGYKSRLFTKEQELVVLKGDNTRLGELIENSQRENREMLDRARRAEQSCNEKTEQCRVLTQQNREDKELIENQRQNYEEKLQQQTIEHARQLEEKDAIVAKQLSDGEAEIARQLEVQRKIADLELAKSRADLQQQAENSKQQMKGSAQHIADTVFLLRSQLNEVDAKIEEATRQLQEATSAIYDALGQTEDDLEHMGAQVEKFPQPMAAPAHSKKTAEPAAAKEKAQPQVNCVRAPAPRRKTVSEGLLELLEKLSK